MSARSREFVVPFRIDPGGGLATTRSQDAILTSHVISVLGTQPTERAMRPTYGCDIQRFAFSTGDASALTEMNDLVRASMEKFCPEARFISLKAQPPDQTGVFVVRVKFSSAADPRDNPFEAVLEFAVQTSGGDVVEVGTSG